VEQSASSLARKPVTGYI